MDTKAITGIFLAVGTAIWVIWDLVVNFNKTQGDTISEVVAEIAKNAPIIPVVLGVMVGHFCGNMPALKPVLDFLAIHPIVGLAVGVVVGVLFWNMGR